MAEGQKGTSQQRMLQRPKDNQPFTVCQGRVKIPIYFFPDYV